MNVINKHIKDHLNSFIDKPSEDFYEVCSNIQNLNKDKYEKLLVYIDNILINMPNSGPNQLNYLHLHIDKDLDVSEKNLILEFLTIKYFRVGLQNDTSIEENEYLKRRKSTINKELNRITLTCPEGARGRNGGNSIYRKWMLEKKEKKEEWDFYNSIPCIKSLKTKTLINTLRKYNNVCVNLFSTNHFGVEIERIEQLRSYVTFNKGKTLNDLDDLIDNVENLFLFDSESKSSFTEFNYKTLEDWNNNFNTSFKFLLIFTFGSKKININSLKNVINQIHFKFKGNKANSYIITNNEVNELTKCKRHNQIKVNFFEKESITFWDNFLLETKIHENLYELFSIKMMNIYSLTLNENIKNIILQSIFMKDTKYHLISDETKQEIPEELESELKETLNNILDYIINSNWKEEIKKSINNDTTLILPVQFIENIELKNELVKELSLIHTNRILTWKYMSSAELENLLFLSYLDPGHFPYYFYPNIIELSAENSRALYLDFFFKNKYQWANYNITNDYYGLLNHKIRIDFFEWHNIKNSVNNLRPKIKEKTYWDIESSYVDSGNREVLKIKFKNNNRSYSYHSSDLFICKLKDSTTALRATELLNFNLTEIEIQSLDEITSALPIYDKLADINKQEDELRIIRQKFNIEEEEDAGRLWKILLKRKSDAIGAKELYAEVNNLLEREDLKIVSFNHFENNWIKPESTSLAPLIKKVFASICNYLELPKTYIILIQRIKNKTRQASSDNTRKLHSLFKDLFNDGCFDDISKTREILNTKINHYKQNHSLEELGIDENYLLENLLAVVDLIIPEIKLDKVDSIENISL